MANKTLIIKQVAKEHGMNLEALATKLGIHRTSLSQALSRNSFSTDKLALIADAIGVEIPDLFEASQRRQTEDRCQGDEVQDNNLSIVCPHCGNIISLHVDEDAM